MLKCSNLFNTLDARGAISVTERVGVIGRVRKLAVGVAEAWVDQQQIRQRRPPHERHLLLEIGSEEIPDWMLPGRSNICRRRVSQTLACEGHPRPRSFAADATRRRLVLRAEGVYRAPARPKTERLGTRQIRARRQPSQASRRKQGIAPDQLEITLRRQRANTTATLKQVPGRATKDILAEALPGS